MSNILTPEDALTKATTTPVPPLGSLKPEEALNYASGSNKNLSVLSKDKRTSDFSPIIEQTNGNSKYDAGYIAGNSNLDDYRANNQSGLAQLGLGVGRTIGGAILNLGEAGSVLASGAGMEAVNAMSAINNEFTSDDKKKTGYYGVDDMVNNPLDNFFYGIEDKMKEQFAVYKPSDWNNKSIAQQMSSTAWWADDGASVAAFALSNIIPAGVIGDLGLGAKVAGAAAKAGEAVVDAGETVGKMGSLGKYANEILLSKAGLTNPVGIAKATDALAQNAYMTTSEAFFMARDAGKAVEENYIQSRGKQDLSELSPQEQQELKSAKATSENYTFWSNMVALTGVSHVEAGFVNRIFGHASTEEIGHLINLGEGVADNATRQETNGVQRFLNTKYGSIAKNVPKYIITEGAIKANIQNAIQAVTTQFGFLGKGDYLQQVASTAISQLSSADAWKGMMANVVVGGLMGVIGGVKEQGAQNKAVENAITSINKAKENFIDLQNVMYQRDGEGKILTDPETKKPLYNVPAIQDFVANQAQAQDLTQLHDIYKNQGNEATAKIIKNEAFTKYALAHLEAGLGDQFIAKVKALNSYKDEDLAKMGFDPIELKEDGSKHTIAEKTQELLSQATQIQKDYKQVNKTIGYQEYYKTGDKVADNIRNSDLKNSRTNEAVKLLSRVRSLDELSKDSSHKLQDLQSKAIQSGENPLVSSINNQARQLEAQKEAFVSGLENGNIHPDSRKANEIVSQMHDLEQTIIRAKEASRPELEKLGYRFESDAKELRDEQPETPDVSAIKGHLQDIEDAKIAKLGLQDKYNKIVDYNNGVDYFVKGIAEKTSRDIDDANLKEDEENTHAQEFSQYKEGDFVQYGDQKGYVTPNDKGELTVNGNLLSKAFLDQNPDIKVLSPEEHQAYKDNKLLQVRKNQVQSKIDQAQRKLEVIKTNLDANGKSLVESKATLNDLISNKETGQGRVSEVDLHAQIKNIQNTIDNLNKQKEELIQQHQQVQFKIEQLQDHLESPASIEDTQDLLEDYKSVLEDINDTIAQHDSLLDKLKGALDGFTKLWQKIFPNKKLNLDAGNYTYLKAKTDIKLTKAEIAEVEKAQADLLEVKTGIEALAKSLEKEISDYQLEANKLEYNPADKPEVTTDVTENPPTVSSSPIPAIEGKGLFKTAGAHSKDGVLNAKRSQKVWGDFANKFDLVKNKTEGQHFRTVTISDPEYGLKGSKQDLYTEEDVKYQHKDNIKVLVVDKDGNPIYHQGSLVYTSLPEITDAKTESEHFPNFRSSNKELAKQAIEEFRDFTNLIKGSNKELTWNNLGDISELTREFNKIGLETEQHQRNIETDKNDFIGELFGRIYDKLLTRDKGLIKRPLKNVINEFENLKKDVSRYTGSKDLNETNRLISLFDKVLNTSSGTPYKLEITGKSNGRIVVGEPISAKEAFGKAVPLQIVTDDKTTIGGNDYPLPKGLVYVNYNGRPVGAEARTLTPAESKAVLGKLKDYAKLRGDKEAVDNGKLLNQIIGTILLNQRTGNPQFDVYFVKGKDELVFGDKSISTKDLIDGKYDDQLREFLDSQNLQVDKKLLDKNQPFTDVFDKQWKSYEDYLLSPRDNVLETPLTFKIAPLSDDIEKPQFLNTSLQYSKPKSSVEVPKPQAKTSNTQASAFEFGTSQPFIVLSDISSPVKTIEEQIAPTEEGIKQFKEESEQNVQTNVLDDLLLHKDVVKDFSPIDYDKEEKWFKENISSTLPFEKVKGLIDKQAYGKFVSSGRVLISDMATEGTAYHEAFHVVSQLYLTDGERQGLYNQWRDKDLEKRTKEGKITSKDVSSNPADRVSDKQVEEALAEEFREYQLTKQSPYKTFFDKILNFIKGLIGIGNSDRDTLFSRISNGYFADAKVKSAGDLNLYKMSDTLGAATTKDVMDSMTLTLVRALFKNNFSLSHIESFNKGLLNETDTKSFANVYESTIASMTNLMSRQAKVQSNEDYINHVIDYINKNKGDIQVDHMKYLTKYGINLQVESEQQFPEDHERSRDTLGIISAIEFSSKSGMPDVIKLMIGSLPKRFINEKGEVKTALNNLGLPKLSDYRKNTAILINELSGLSSFKEQMIKLQELSTKVPEFSYIFDQLGITDVNNPTPPTLREDHADLQAKFRQQFDKAYYDFHTQLYDGNNSRLLDSNSDRISSTLKARWEGNSYKNKDAYKIVAGKYVLEGDYFKNKYDKALKGEEKAKSVLSFYKDLGIVFSNPGLVDIDVLADKQKALIKKIQDKQISNIFQDEAESKGFVNSVLEQELSTTEDYSDNQHINPEGKTVYNVSLHNYLTRIAALINNVGLPKELTWDEKTQQGNPLLRNSEWAVKIRNKQKIVVSILEGARINQTGETGVSTADLSYPNAASQQFVSVLAGRSPYLRAADQALEHAIGFGEAPSFAGLDEITNYFKGHLADELLSSHMLNVEGIGAEFPEYANSANDLRVFKGALNKADEKYYQELIKDKTIDRKEAIRRIDAFVDRDSVKADLQKWFDKYAEENKKVILDQKLVSEVAGQHSLLGIPTELADKYVGKADNLSEGQMKSLVEQFTYNQLKGNIEQTKLFTGDLAFYKDFFKRTKGATGTGKTTWVGGDFDAWLNENRKREYQAPDGSIKVDKKSDSKIQSLMFNDAERVSANFKTYLDNLVSKGLNKEYANKLLDNYNQKYKEGDAQGYLTLPEYREFLTRTGDWTPSHEILYPKLIRGEEISPRELGGFLSGFPVLKPQYFGDQTSPELFVPTYYKFSAMPLIPSVVRGTELEELMHTMLETGHGLSLFKSGNKVGAKEGNDLYDEDNKINLDAKKLITQELDYASMKIQLDINPKTKDRAIFGTQFRKLIQEGMLNKILTINGKKVDGNKLLQNYTNLINKTVELETKHLINRLGLKDAGNNQFRLENPQALREILEGEAFNRQSPDNVIEGIRQVLPKEGEHKQFDVLVDRNKIEHLLMSLINNSAIKQKTFGDMRVQGATTGFQSKDTGEQPTKFYTPHTDGETEPIGVLMPHYFKDASGNPLDIGYDDITDKRLLRMVDYRTPTEKLNSMDAMEIADFHPQEAGNLITKPSETVVKDGSDYDVDKVTIHFPNYELVDGKPKYLEYDKKNPEHQEDLRRIYNRINEIAYKVLTAPENFQNLITPNSTGIVEKLANKVAAMKTKSTSDLDNGKGYNVSWKKNLDTRQAFLSGKEGLGIAALHTPNHILNQIVQLKAKPEVKIFLDHNNTTEKPNIQTKEVKIQMQPDNIQKILSGDKTSTTRSESQANIIGLKIGETGKTEIGGKEFNITNKGLLNIQEAGGKENILKSEGINSENDFKYQQTKNWINGNGKLYVYEIKPYIQQVGNQIDFGKEREVGADPINSPSIIDNLSAFMNGLVDMANNPFLSTMNVTLETLPIYMYLTKAGTPMEQQVMFMNQPIISDYLKEASINDSLFLKATDNKLGEEKLIQKVLDMYPAKQAKLDLTNQHVLDNYKKTITTKRLEEYIKGNTNNAVQQQILLDFLRYKDDSEGLSDLIRATTPDTRGTGSTMNSAQNVIDNFENLKENSIFENVDKYLDNTFLGSFHNAITKSVEIYKPVFYTEKTEIKNELSKIKQVLQLNKRLGTDKTEKALNLAKNDIINYVLQSTPIEGLTIKNNVKDLFTGENSLAKVLVQAKEHPAYRDNPIIKELVPLISSNSTNEIPTGNDLDKIKMFSKRLEAADSNIITEGWKDLFNLNPQFAQNLMTYTIMQSGLNNSPSSFTQYVPNEHYVPLASRLLGNKDVDFKDFYDKFMRNNYQNDDLAPKISKYVMTRNGLYTIADGQVANVLPPGRSKITGKLLGRDNTKYDYIKAWSKSLNGYELYRNTGEVNNNGSVVFERVSKLGDGYNLKEWTDESAVLSNRISTSNKTSNSVLNNLGSMNFQKNQLEDMLEKSSLAEEQKQEFAKKLAEAKDGQDIAKLLKEICA